MSAAAAWPERRLGQLATMGSGGTPSSAVPSYYGGGVPWVSIGDMTASGKYVRHTAKTLTDAGLAASAARLYEPDVVLYAMYASLGECALAVGRVSSSQAILGIKPGRELDRHFLYYFLDSIKPLVRSMGQHGTQANLNAGMVRDFRLPLPSIAEQRRIARALADADELIAALDRLIAKKRAVKQAMMQQLLTGKTRLPGFADPWRSTTLGALGTFLKGRGVKRDDLRSTGVRCIRYGELYTAFESYTSEARSFVSVDVSKSALPLKSGDLLFAASGETREEIGKCVAYTGPTPAVAGGDVIVLRGDRFDSIYLALVANTPEVVSQKARAGQGDAVVHIYSSALDAIEVTLPPRLEQEAIARVIVDADSEVDALADRLAKAKNVKQGMMQELLTGRTRLPGAEAAA